MRARRAVQGLEAATDRKAQKEIEERMGVI